MHRGPIILIALALPLGIGCTTGTNEEETTQAGVSSSTNQALPPVRSEPGPCRQPLREIQVPSIVASPRGVDSKHAVREATRVQPD